MTLVAQRTITGAQVRPNVTLDRRRRRLSTIVRRQADLSRHFIVSVHRRGQPVAPTDLDVVLRKEWKDKLVGPQDIVLITYLPQGGAGKGGSILMAVAAIALSIIVPFAVGALGGPFATATGSLTMLGKVVSTGIIMGGMALLGQAFKPKANKPEEQRPIYGVSGGGNLARPGDRIPRLYGRCYTVPDLSQPDYYVYEGEYQILYKRMVLGLGRVFPHRVRVNGQTMATCANGRDFSIKAPFAGSRIEIIYPGETSSLVPQSVVTSPSVQGNELPRPDSTTGEWSGPFIVNAPGQEISKIQLDISAPQGLISTFINSEGAQEWGAEYGWRFEYAEVNEVGSVIGDWKELDQVTGTRLEKRPVRWTRIRGVPRGPRYAVRGKNLYTTDPPHERVTSVTNGLQWDALRGYVPGTVTRDNVTELAIMVRSSAALGVTSFSNIDVECTGLVPVWNGSSWSTPTPSALRDMSDSQRSATLQQMRKCVWIFADILRNSVYGAGLPTSAIDVETLQYYADTLTRYDTFDGVIRGPDSIWNVASTVLFPMRAEPVQLGRIWSLVRDDQKAVRPHVITSRQIVSGSSGIVFDTDPDRGDGHVVAEYYHNGDPRRLTPVKDPNTNDDVYYGSKSLTPQRLSMFGVTSLSHAVHLARWVAASAFYRRQTVRFTTEYDGRIYTPGSSINVELWFMGQSKVASIVDRDGDVLTLDHAVSVVPGDALVLRDRSGREWGPVTITQTGPDEITLDSASRAAVEASTGLTLSNVLSLDGMEETTALIAQPSILSRNYLVRVAKPSGRDRMDIEAVIDHPQIWSILNERVFDPPESADEPDPLPPDNLAVTERLYLDGNEVKAAAQVSWRRTDSRALMHEVEYRFDFLQVASEGDEDVTIEPTATDGQWRSAGVTDGLSLEILDIPASRIDVRVRAIYVASAVSAWVYLNDVTISGVLRPPSDVTGFAASVLGDIMTLSWDAVPDIHLSHYQVRYSPRLTGVQWGTAVPLVPRVPIAGTQVPAMRGTYLVKAVSGAGIMSANAAIIVSDVTGITAMNVVETFVEHPTFPGAKTDVVADPTLGGLQLGYAEDVYAREDWYAPGLDWYLGTEGLVPEGTYEFAETLDLGGVYTSRLTAVLDVTGVNLTDDVYAVEDIYAMEDFYQSAAPSLWDVWLEYRATNDDPDGSPDWGDWRPVTIGDVTARAFQFRVRLAGYEFGVTPVVTRLEVSIDMPDRVIADNNIVVPDEGLRIDFVPPFIGYGGLGTVAQGMSPGDRLEITNVDETGFDARFYNSLGEGVTRTLDYIAKGHGRREA